LIVSRTYSISRGLLRFSFARNSYDKVKDLGRPGNANPARAKARAIFVFAARKKCLSALKNYFAFGKANLF
jgi:hypothetical protein